MRYLKVFTMAATLAAVLAASLVSAPRLAEAQAADVSVLSLKRLSIGAGIDYAWRAAEANPSEAFRRGFEIPIVGAYNLISPPAGQKGTHWSLVGAVFYGTSAKLTEGYTGARVGIRATLYDGSRQ